MCLISFLVGVIHKFSEQCTNYTPKCIVQWYIFQLARARVGAQSGLGPGPGWGPYGPIWALMFFFKSDTFRVQTAPLDKITIDFWRSRRRLLIPDLLKAKKMRRRIIIF